MKPIVNGEFLDMSSFRMTTTVSFKFNNIPMCCKVDQDGVFVMSRMDKLPGLGSYCEVRLGYNRETQRPQVAWAVDKETVDLDLRVAVDVCAAMLIYKLLDAGVNPSMFPTFSTGE